MEVDTIVARATPAGVGGLAVVRISGPAALSILEAVTAGQPMPDARKATLVRIVDPDDGHLLDRAVVTRYEAPASYTGEDVVEVACHGGWLTPRLIVDACLRSGARVAEPGEFTRRAYLRGKLDLVQAEAVADLIEARSGALRDAAVHQLERGLSSRVASLRDRVLRVEALLAHHVDFPEEDDAPVPVDEIVGEASRLVDDMDGMLATAPEGELLREGALAVFAGRANVGKSSLYNALIGEERAIVTEEAGTTRDALETTVQLGGYPFRLVDTAGLRSSDERVEQLGIEVARRYVERADVLLYCAEAGRPLDAEECRFVAASPSPVVLIETKLDATDARGRATEGCADRLDVAGEIGVSVETGEGLDRLRSILPELVYSSVVSAGDESPVLTRRRHARALQRARDEVAAFGRGLEQGLPPEVAATHLRSAETELEELLGIVSPDDILDVVFREFCIGK